MSFYTFSQPSFVVSFVQTKSQKSRYVKLFIPEYLPFSFVGIPAAQYLVFLTFRNSLNKTYLAIHYYLGTGKLKISRYLFTVYVCDDSKEG